MSDISEQPVYIITGATGGLGSVVARELNKRSISTVLCGRNVKMLEDLYDELDATGTAKPSIYPVNHSGATMPDYEQLMQTVETEYGRLDGLLYCAAELGRSTPVSYTHLTLPTICSV